MKKIILFLIIIFTLYVMLVFITPEITEKFSKKLGILKVQEIIVDIKSGMGIASTSEAGDFLSGALEIWGQIKDGIDDTKDSIDTVREKIQNVEEKYNTAKENYDKVITVIDKVWEIAEIAESIWWTWATQ